MSDRLYEWGKRPALAFIGKLGEWGLYAMVGVAFIGFFLNLVDARNERVWWAVLAIGQAGALAWLGSWVVLLGVGLASWLVGKLSNRGD
jgi:predicted branched-subunit amino acid permease